MEKWYACLKGKTADAIMEMVEYGKENARGVQEGDIVHGNKVYLDEGELLWASPDDQALYYVSNLKVAPFGENGPLFFDLEDVDWDITDEESILWELWAWSLDMAEENALDLVEEDEDPKSLMEEVKEALQESRQEESPSVFTHPEKNTYWLYDEDEDDWGYYGRKRLVAPSESTIPKRDRVKEPAEFKLERKTFYIDGSGTLFYKAVGEMGAQVIVKAPKEITDRVLGDVKTLNPTVIKAPGSEHKIPVEVLKGWARALLDAPGEALAGYGYKDVQEADGTLCRYWLAVVPLQEVTCASADIKDWKKATKILMEQGYNKIGTIHTHPGEMLGCSSTDKDEAWRHFSGVHYIVTRGGYVSTWFSLGGETFPLGGEEWKYPCLGKETPEEAARRGEFKAQGLVDEDGLDKVKEMLKSPAPRTYDYTHQQQVLPFQKYTSIYQRDHWPNQRWGNCHEQECNLHEYVEVAGGMLPYAVAPFLSQKGQCSIPLKFKGMKRCSKAASGGWPLDKQSRENITKFEYELRAILPGGKESPYWGFKRTPFDQQSPFHPNHMKEGIAFQMISEITGILGLLAPVEEGTFWEGAAEELDVLIVDIECHLHGMLSLLANLAIAIMAKKGERPKDLDDKGKRKKMQISLLDIVENPAITNREVMATLKHLRPKDQTWDLLLGLVVDTLLTTAHRSKFLRMYKGSSILKVSK